MPSAKQGENEAALEADVSLETLFSMKGKVALVTGGGSGIGAMIAVALARNGARVYIASRKDTTEFASAVPGVIALRCDIGKAEEAKSLLEEIKEREGKLHLLINNAGTNFSAPIGKHPADAFDKVMQINVRSVFDLTQLAAPLLEASSSQDDPARVINISSINGLRVPAGMDTFSYSSSKAAVVMLSKHLAARLSRKHILVNSICPGPFESRMMRGLLKAVGKNTVSSGTAVGRLGSPQDIAAAVLYLCGRGGSYVTGSEIVVDGGSLVSPTSHL